MSLESQKPQLNDQEIQFKKRARRRLVGAIALVLLMVAVLPMVLDDRTNKAPPQEIAISIPSQDSGEFTSKIVPVSPASEESQTDNGADATVDTPVEQTAADKQSSQASESPVNNTSENQKLPTQTIAKPNKVAEPAIKKEAVKPVVQTANMADLPGKLPDDKKLASAATVTPAYVQIGVFSDPANVKQLQQKLSALGFKSYTEKIATSKGEKIRLRAGPYSKRADAEEALGKIKSGGLSGMVVSK